MRENEESGSITHRKATTHQVFGLKQIYPDPNDKYVTTTAEIDIIALHGLDAKSPRTWIAWRENDDPNSGDVHWLKDSHMLPAVVPKSRILTYDWNANYDTTASTDRFLGHADTFLDRISNEREKSERRDAPIIFIASCFSGLLVAQALTRAAEGHHPRRVQVQQILNCTTGVAFLGTPFRGIWDTGYTIADLQISFATVSRTEYARELIEYLRPGTPERPSPLDTLRQRFSEMIHNDQYKFDVVCFYETRRSKISARINHLPREYAERLDRDGCGIVVSQDSACLEGVDCVPLDRRHNMLHKFSSPSDDDFRRLASRLKTFRRQPISFQSLSEDYTSRLDRRQIDVLQSLHTCPYLERKNRNSERVPGTCQWFVGHDYFRQWQKGQSSRMLWVSANPGCGKSVLAKFLVDDVLRTTGARTTCYFFFKEDYEDQRSAADALSCILYQLFKQKAAIFSHAIIERFETYGHNLPKSFDEFWEILLLVSHDDRAGEIVCILDAFDECEDQERLKFARALRKFYVTTDDVANSSSLKFLVTSRPYNKISQGFEPLDIPGLPIIHLKGEDSAESTKIAEEIDIFVKYQVTDIQRRLQLSRDEEMLLLARLRRNPNPTYLWVSLVLQMIDEDLGIDRTKILDVTSDLPETVDEAYEKILAKSDNPGSVKKLLHIVVAAARPLTVAEMSLALVLEERHKSFQELGVRPEERSKRHIRNLCGFFVNIMDDSKIYLIHQTAREFLVSKDDTDTLKVPESIVSQSLSNKITFKNSLDHRDSNRVLCQICLRYLLLSDFDDIVDILSPVRVFLEYSATNWASHFRVSNQKPKSVTDSLQRICDVASSRFSTWFNVYWATKDSLTPRNLSSLIVASYFGLEELVKLQLQSANVDVNHRDSTYGRSAVLWASMHGFSGIVDALVRASWSRRLLPGAVSELVSSVKIDGADHFGLTPLAYALLNGHESVVRKLIAAGASAKSLPWVCEKPKFFDRFAKNEAIAKRLMRNFAVTAKLRTGQSLLEHFSEKGNADVVRLLLDQGAVAEQKLLITASTNGHEAVVRLLLDIGLHTEARDLVRSTPLIKAAQHGYEAVVKLLLDKGADTEARNDFWDSALTAAAFEGHEGVTRLLLDQGADIEGTNEIGQTALFLAVVSGHEAVVEILLAMGANIHVKNVRRTTPLSQAVKMGHVALVDLLLSYGANIESEDENQETPLFRAIKMGHEAVANLLLDCGANIESKGRTQQTPLFKAVLRNNETMCNLLLQHGADIESRDANQETPLFRAIEIESEAIVCLLLYYGADYESRNANQETPLFKAVSRNNRAMCYLLLHHGADIESRDTNQDTPLFRAIEKGHESICTYLLFNGANIESRDANQDTPLFRAIKKGHEAICYQLLFNNADINSRDTNQETPLFRAIEKGHDAICIRLLLLGADVSLRNTNQETPLFRASEKGYEAICIELLLRGADINWRDTNQETPLFRAIEKECEAVVDLLLDRGANHEIRNANQETPLSKAMFTGNRAIFLKLVGYGTSMEVQNDSQKTPLGRARDVQRQEIVQFISASREFSES
ncbi:Ankyrin repeat protein [Moelleriella libera RCEF 2490]|uniref:Ankyrin repeat protein n=1 Tax=Moelleriella libera RCEF 2490 TaxID=1081109 RepID=A0A168EPU0_9HYPO|nr:Ankyrin repeat protein [Moelleriella libera RCEF 2490]